ncbi:MAG: tetratricopeptide repeat protein, partial [Geitlerinemataceae cyanobacterium]
MLDLSSNPLFVSAGITTSITCAISGYALYELLSVGPEETETARVINPQLRRQPISANIVPNVSAPENWSVRPGKRPDFMPIASNTLSPEGAVAHTLIALWKQGKLPQHLAPLMQQAESGIDEFQAKGYLEAARIQATQQDYAKALKYLKQISTEVSVHPQAQAKIAEYTEKQTLQAKAWMQKANALAKLKDFSGARIYLKQVPDNTPVYPVAQNKMNEYAQTQNVQANFWFKEASKLASQGKLSAAITYLQRIPLGTSIYTVAQNKITEYSQKQSLKAATPKPKAAVTTPTPKVATPATPAVAKPPKPATPTVTPTPSPTVATPATPDVTTP